MGTLLAKCFGIECATSDAPEGQPAAPNKRLEAPPQAAERPEPAEPGPPGESVPRSPPTSLDAKREAGLVPIHGPQAALPPPLHSASDDELRDAVRDDADFSFEGVTTDIKPVDIYDGDTLRIKFRMHPGGPIIQYKARMAEYDSPEMKPPKTSPTRDQEIKAALAARNHLASLLGGRFVRKLRSKKDVFEGGRVVVATLGKFDKYGRILLTIHADGDITTLNQQMINSGHGYPYSGGTKQEFSE